MISTKEAAAKAIEKMQEYFPEAINNRLEEIEVHDKEIWLTLSFEIPEEIPTDNFYESISIPSSPDDFRPKPLIRYVRIFRLFKINSESGAFISMHHSSIEV